MSDLAARFALRTLAFLLLATVFSCRSDISGITPDGDIVLEEGETIQVRPDGPYIRFVGVESDTRCPVDLRCVWAGRAEIVIEISPDRSAWQREVLAVSTRGVDYGDLRIAILELLPERSNSLPEPDTYQITIHVSRS